MPVPPTSDDTGSRAKDIVERCSAPLRGRIVEVPMHPAWASARTSHNAGSVTEQVIAMDVPVRRSRQICGVAARIFIIPVAVPKG